MQSDATPNQSIQQPPLRAASGHVSLQEVMNTLPNVDASNPLDFVLKATSQSVTVPEPKPVETPKPVEEPKPEPKAEAPIADPVPNFDESVELKPDDKQEEPAAEEDDIDSIPDDPVKENYLKLKAKAKTAKQEAKELKTKYEEATQELEKYRKGEVVPEVLQNLENRVAELSKWEKLYNLKSSPEYMERFVQPLEDASTRLKTLFKEYGADDQQVQAALNHVLKLENKADLNKFLSANFDALGATEAKELVSTIKQLEANAAEAEKEPMQAIERLQAESAQIKAAQEMQRVEKIKGVAKESWFEALVDIRNEGKITELIRQESNPEFNKKFVDPILTQSANEYGKLITELGKQGVKDLPKNLAKGLAQMVLRATAQAVAFEARDAALEYANSLKSTASRVDQLFRPPVGGGAGRAAPPPAPKEVTPASAADTLVNSILQKR